jgi:hypothetical protein
MENHQECPLRPDVLTLSTQVVYAPTELLPVNRRLVLDPEMRTVLLLSLNEEAETPFFRTFLLSPSATPMFLALLQHYPHHCPHRELFAMLYPHGRHLDESTWEQERNLAIPLIRRALKSLLPILRECGLQALSVRGQGYVLAPLAPSQKPAL